MPRTSTKSKTAAEPKVTPPPEPVKPVEVEVSDVEEAPVKKTVRRKPREVSLDELNAEYERVLKSVSEEADRLKEGEGGKKGPKNPHVAYLKSLEKDLKGLRLNSTKALKTKQKVKRETNVRSGFMKPVKISAEMAKFTGWDPSQEYSRVDVTKFICQYIREHNLQNQEDRRKIVPDDKLAKLLKCSKTTNDLSYCSLQKVIQPHFVKPVST